MLSRIISAFSLALLGACPEAKNTGIKPIDCSQFGFQGAVSPGSHTVVLLEHHGNNYQTFQCFLHLILHLGPELPDGALVYEAGVARGEHSVCTKDYTNEAGVSVACTGWDNQTASEAFAKLTRIQNENGLKFNRYETFLRHFVNHDLARIYQEEKASRQSASGIERIMDNVIDQMEGKIKEALGSEQSTLSPQQAEEYRVIARAIQQVKHWRQEENLYYEAIFATKGNTYTEDYQASICDVPEMISLHADRERSLAEALTESSAHNRQLHLFSVGLAFNNTIPGSIPVLKI
jgi:hypothetical protein